MKITQLHALRVRIPQKAPIAPYQNRYKAGTYKECILVRLETDGGLVGWGETPEDWINKSFEGTPEEPMRNYAVALPLARDLEKYNLEYFEQPMPFSCIGESARLRKRTKTPLGLNESVTTLEIVTQILELRAADVLLPDTYQCGGILGVKKVATLCEAANIPCVFHCAHDLGPKTAAMLHVVASGPSFTLANDCTYYGLEADIS